MINEMNDEQEIQLEKCEKGHSNQCTSLGLAYKEGYVVKPCPIEAAKFFERGCELKDGWGCFHLAVAYQKGFGVKQNDKKTLEFYDKACSLHIDEACWERESFANYIKNIRGVKK